MLESLIGVAILLALAFPILAIAALVVALNARSDAHELRLRILKLEAGAPEGATPAAALAPPATPARTPPPMPEPPPIEAAVSGSSPLPPPLPIPASPPPARPLTTLEERFGTQWVVWIGGLALALGGIFLVRYAVEQDLLGPGVRIVLGFVFAAILIGAGEWTRRGEIATGIAALPTRHIPSILTAAGTIAAYATVYAAYGLYDFLAPGAAFVLLGLVALATLFVALLHGPALAGLGLAGAFVTPLLVSTNEPSYWALYAYLAVVTAAAFALARMRLWRWLAITAVALGALWTLPGIDYPHVTALGAHLFHVVAGFALAAAMIVSGLFYGPEAEPGKIDEVSSGSIAAYALAATFIVCGSLHDPAALTVFTVLAIATVAICWRTEAALYALPAAGLFSVIVMLHWLAPRVFEDLVLPSGVTAGAIPEPSTGTESHLALGAALALLFGVSGFAAQPRAKNALIWSGTSVVAPIAILVALYARISGYDRSIPFAGLALLLAALYGCAADLLSKREPQPGSAGSTAVYAAGAVSSLALALTFALEKGWLTVALALMAPGLAWISKRRPLPALRWLAAATAAVVVLRIGYEPRIVGRDVGTAPIFNWLLYGYGVPAASFWYAATLMRRRGDDVPVRITDAAAILFTVLLVFLQIRHFINGGDVYAPSAGLTEIALQVCAGLAMTIGLERLRLRSRSIVHDLGALILAALTLAGIVFGLLFAENPLLHTAEVGGPFVNLILLGYGIPALLAATLALIVREHRPLPYRYIAAATAVALSLLYLTIEVRRLYIGPIITPRVPTGDAEQYTYSAVWLAFGVALLMAGFFLRSQPARLASAAVIAITIGKVFLFDMAGLTGIFRALSFIGLGAVLVGIGWLYQRVLFPAQRQAITANSNNTG